MYLEVWLLILYSKFPKFLTTTPSYPGLNDEGWVNPNPEEPAGCALGFAPKVNTPGLLPVKLKLAVLLPNWNAEPRRDTHRFSFLNETHFLS